MTAIIRRCDNCVHYYEIVEDFSGQCKRYPPVPVAYKRDDGDYGIKRDPVNYRPEVDAANWCGEFNCIDHEKLFEERTEQ